MMTSIPTETKDCLRCRYFRSFADDYFDDMEPNDRGFCLNGKSAYYYNEGAGFGVVCKLYSELEVEQCIPNTE